MTKDNTQADSPHYWRPTTNTMAVFKCRNCGLVGYNPHPLPELGCTAIQTIDDILIDHRHTSKNKLKEAITDWHNKQVEAVLNRIADAWAPSERLKHTNVTIGEEVFIDAIEAERNKLKEKL